MIKSRVELSAALFALLAGAACATPAPPPSPMVLPPDTVLVVDTVRVVTDAEINTELENQVARMQIQLLERDVQIEELRGQLDQTRQELVRNLAKLQSQASRAEAASGLAEAEIALQALGRAPGGDELPEFGIAKALIAESTAAFNADNYGGALYLATEARAEARNGQLRLGGSTATTLREGEELFALPVPLQTVSRSNVRDGPGLSFDVLFTLEGGLGVVGHSHTNQWVRILDDGGREGWIFHTLVSGRIP